MTVNPVLLNAYTGAAPLNETYTADAPWISAGACNGVITSMNTTGPGGCSGANDTSTKIFAKDIGLFLGQSTGAAADNHAVASNTGGNPGANLIEFATVQPIPFVAANRFVTFGVIVGVGSCQSTDPLLNFALVPYDGAHVAGTPVPLFTSAINPCTSTASVPPATGTGTGTSTRVGSYTGDTAALFTGSELGIQMRNANGSGAGNDHAFDGVRVLDATPQLDQTFSQRVAPVGATVSLTYTITNTNDLASKVGWSFADTLPAGLTIANPLTTTTTTCANGSILGTTTTEVHVTGDLTVGQTSCTVTVHVSSSAIASYTSQPAHFTVSGLELPASATVKFGETLSCTAPQIRAGERNWIFGNSATLDFGTSGTAPPVAGKTPTTFTANEGSTTVSDSQGNLLFYANGGTVFNRNGTAMPNGNGLNGNGSAVQTGAVFPAAGRPGVYFLVETTADYGGSPVGTLTYSVIDMSLNGGLGDVTTKNVQLGDTGAAGEAVTATPNAAKTGFWVMTTKAADSDLRAYEFDADGPVDGVAVLSQYSPTAAGPVRTLNMSADASRVVMVETAAGGRAFVMDFDSATGQVDPVFEWVAANPFPYAADFSPSGDYVYTTGIGSGYNVNRYKLAGAANSAAVLASQQTVGTVPSAGGGEAGQVKRGPDGRMYIAGQGTTKLSVVNDPDNALPGSVGFVAGGVQLATGSSSSYGLPQTATGCTDSAALDDSAVTDSASAVTVTPLANDTPPATTTFVETSVRLLDGGGNPVTTLTTADGSYTVNTTPGPNAGKVTYTPNGTFTGHTVPVIYRVSDSGGGTHQAYIRITVDLPACDGHNLVLNGDAETAIGSEWVSTTGTLSRQAYGGGGFPGVTNNIIGGGTIPNEGVRFFHGGATAEMFAHQTIALSATDMVKIATGTAKASLSAFIGGFSNHADRMGVTVTWKDAGGATVGTTLTLDPVTNAERQSRTGFLPRSDVDTIPSTAVSAVVELHAIRGSGSIDDGYIDNLKLTLLCQNPPTIAKEFTPTTTAPGTPATAKFTIDNSAGSVAVTGWSFNDDLPANLKIAPAPNASTTCPNGTVSAPANGITIGVLGDVGALTTCTILVDVVSSVNGTYVNDASNISSTIGLTPPTTPAQLIVGSGDTPPLVACTPAQTAATQRHWFFGGKGEIDFGPNGTTPTALVGPGATNGSAGAGDSIEGTTVVSDTSGVLQFWSNGTSIFDRTGAVMPNGGGLTGNPSATQTVAAFPSVANPGKYFVVTTDANLGPGRLRYSVVDMSLNGGLGDVVSGQKEIVLGAAGTASEALTAVPNSAGTGFWVLTYTPGTADMLAYAFNSTGPTTGSAVTSTMPSGANRTGYGSIRANPADLSQLVSISDEIAGVATDMRLLKFNASTGGYTETAAWAQNTAGGSNGYTAEFSPSGKYVYATRIFSGGVLLRYDVGTTPTSVAIKASETTIGSIGSNGGAVRLATDGKLYIANHNAATISVLSNPDSASPTLATNGFALASGTVSRFGLPQFVTGCPFPKPTIKKAFTPAQTHTNTPSTAKFTIDNTASPQPENDWDFTDALVTGLVVATPSTTSSTCPNTVIVAVAGSGTIDVTGDIAAGATCTVSVDVVSATPGTYTNGPANISSTTGLIPPPANVTFTVDPSVDLKITAGPPVPGTGAPGESVTVPIKVHNDGPDPAGNVVVTYPLPPGTTPGALPPGCVASAAVAGVVTVTCTAATVPPGGDVTFQIPINIPPGATGTLTNVPVVTSDGHELTPGDNTTTLLVPLVPSTDISVTIDPNPDPVVPGMPFKYTVKVHNDGPSDATDIVVIVPLPPGTTPGTLPPGCTASGPVAGVVTVTCTVPALPDGEAKPFEIPVNVPPGQTMPLVVTPHVTGHENDPTPDNNTTTRTTTVTPLAPPTITFTGVFGGGDPITVTQGDPLVALFSCAAAAGVRSCVGTGPNGGSVDTSIPGTYTFTVTVVDQLGRTVTKTVTYVVKPKPGVKPRKTGAQLILECAGAKLVLLDVRIIGDHVRLQGVTDVKNAGRQVAIALTATAPAKVVARPIVQPNGFFESTAPLPPKSIRFTNKARYQARLDNQKSLDLKLIRRMNVTGLSIRNGKITISGRVTKPLAAPISTIMVKQRTECGKPFKIVARVKPPGSGFFKVTVPKPAGIDSAIYRLETSVRRTLRSKGPFRTYTLVRGVDLF